MNDMHICRKPLILLLTAAAALLSSCLLTLPEETGTLLLRFGGAERSVLWTPGISTEIVSYRIAIAGPDGFTRTEIYNISSAKQNEFRFESLRAGSYTVTIDGYNSVDGGGDLVASLARNSSGGRTLEALVYRSEVTEIAAVLVASTEGTGSIEFDLALQNISRELLQKDPRIIVGFEHIDGLMLGSDSLPAVQIFSGAQALSEGSGFTTEYTQENTRCTVIVDPSGTDPEDTLVRITNLPSGWYEITAELQSDICSLQDGTGECGELKTNRIWKGVSYARVAESGQGLPTKGNFTVYSSMLETGSFDMTLYADLDPMIVTLSYEGMQISGSGEAEENRISIEEQTPVSISADIRRFVAGSLEEVASGITCRWFVNGERVDEGQSPELVQYDGFREAGEYTLTLAVLRDGALNDNGFGAASATVHVASPTQEN
jgi:hypothetical protein